MTNFSDKAMSSLARRYDGLEDPWLRAELLDAAGINEEQLRTWRQKEERERRSREAASRESGEVIGVMTMHLVVRGGRTFRSRPRLIGAMPKTHPRADPGRVLRGPGSAQPRRRAQDLTIRIVIEVRFKE